MEPAVGGGVETFLGGRGGGASVLCSPKAVSSGGPNKALVSSAFGEWLLGGFGTGAGEAATATGTMRRGRTMSSFEVFLFKPGLRLRRDGDRAMLPMEALSSSTVGAVMTQSGGRGLILILNFRLCSSSSSDSSEEKKCVFLGPAPSSDSSSGLML